MSKNRYVEPEIEPYIISTWDGDEWAAEGSMKIRSTVRGEELPSQFVHLFTTGPCSTKEGAEKEARKRLFDILRRASQKSKNAPSGR